MHSDEVTASQSLVVKQIRLNSGQVHTAQPVIQLFEHARSVTGPSLHCFKSSMERHRAVYPTEPHGEWFGTR